MTPAMTPTGPRLAELRKAIAEAQDLAHDLNDTSTPTAYEAVAEALAHAYEIARDLALPHGRTGCPTHPDGATDPHAPNGWGNCLVCNTHRRRAQRNDHATHTAAAKIRAITHMPIPTHPIAQPSPEYAKAAERLSYLPDLGAASLQAARTQLGPDAPYEHLVLHAAANPIQPATASSAPDDQNDTPQEHPDCPTCGTALDPDGTCWNCTNGTPK